MDMSKLLDSFIKKNNGKFVEESDPTNKNQCMDLIYPWCDILGAPRECIRRLYAYQVYSLPTDLSIQYFEYIPNTPKGLPIAGDIAIFGKGVGPAGHICIATGKSDYSKFESFDQNWPTYSPCKKITHTYAGILGWLRIRDNSKVKELEDKLNKIKALVA